MFAARLDYDVLGPPDEGRDALIAAALDRPERAIAAWRRWEAAVGRDDRDVIAERWMPLIGSNVADAPLDSRTRQRFQASRRTAWASNVRIISAARPAVRALHAAGVPTIVLKGAALANSVYTHPGLRPIGDVDVLIAPEHGELAQRVLSELEWRPSRHAGPRDRQLVHAFDLRKPPDGALDVHWYLLSECCWPGADAALWRRAVPMPDWGAGAATLGPADHLVHVCLHGLRWSPVHGGFWIADAVRIIVSAGAALDWDVVVDEASSRAMALQMLKALQVVRTRGHGAVPDEVLRRLAARRMSWHERIECRFKGRPVVSAAGMFVLWAGWRRSARMARTRGVVPPPWLRYLAAELGVPSPVAIAPRLAAHAASGVTRLLRGRPRRGGSARARLSDGIEPA